MGLYKLLLMAALLLAPALAAPAPTFDPVTSVALTAAGGLVLSTASGAITIPTVALLAGKAVAIKGLLVARDNHERTGNILGLGR